MTQNEIKLFFSLCSFRSIDTEGIEELLNQHCDTPWVLGQLFYHRMTGIAYCTLLDSHLLSKVNREFRTSIQNSWKWNEQRNKSYFQNLRFLNDLLCPYVGSYAMLKGAFLCAWYPIGCRTSNDVDLLVNKSSVTVIGDSLRRAGFQQGYIRDDRFEAASRGDIISSSMQRGETVPFIKEMNDPFMPFLEVDLNFSLDYKGNNDTTVKHLLSRSVERNVRGLSLHTLNPYDFLVHLCEHLYKEATVLPWIEMQRDMTLYKFCDLYALMTGYEFLDMDELIISIHALNAELPCFYAFYGTKLLYGLQIPWLDRLLACIMPADSAFLSRVISPKDKKLYAFTEPDFRSRFFCDHRIALLKEVPYEEAKDVFPS